MQWLSTQQCGQESHYGQIMDPTYPIWPQRVFNGNHPLIPRENRPSLFWNQFTRVFQRYSTPITITLWSKLIFNLVYLLSKSSQWKSSIDTKRKSPITFLKSVYEGFSHIHYPNYHYEPFYGFCFVFRLFPSLNWIILVNISHFSKILFPKLSVTPLTTYQLKYCTILKVSASSVLCLFMLLGTATASCLLAFLLIIQFVCLLSVCPHFSPMVHGNEGMRWCKLMSQIIVC